MTDKTLVIISHEGPQMTTNPIDTKPAVKPTSIHDFVQEETPEALRKLKEGYHQLAFINWAKETFGDQLLEGISIKGFHHRSSAGDVSEFHRMSMIMQTRLSQAGFSEDDISNYLNTIDKLTTAETLSEITNAIGPKQEQRIHPF